MINTLTYRNLVVCGLVATLFFSLSACSRKEAEPQPSEEVTQFYEKLFQTVEQYSINRRIIDWSAYRKAVIAEVGNATQLANTTGAMRLALSLLKDDHSAIGTPDGKFISAGRSCQAFTATTKPTRPGIGYIRLNGFSGGGQEAVQLAQAIQGAIREQDVAGLKGWVVDLRTNTGGNMWPMLAGIGPVLGEGICGYFYDIDTKPISAWKYQNGASINGETVQTQVAQPYALKSGTTRVAVLISGATASSGEAVAIAFVGRPNTRLFGTGSCGLSTANNTINLPKNYVLALTVATMANRTGKVYGKEIVPDVVVSADADMISRAEEWIGQ